MIYDKITLGDFCIFRRTRDSRDFIFLLFSRPERTEIKIAYG